MNIKRFTNGDVLDQDTLNAPLGQIENALNSLENYIKNTATPSALTIYNAVCNSEVAVGDVVYYNEGVINKALAVYSATFDNEGELLAKPSAYPIGVVVNKNAAGVADVVVAGKFTPSSVFIANVFNNVDAFGEYYLSGDTAGAVSITRPVIPVRVFTYNIDHTITLNISNPPTNYHKHTYCELEYNKWTLIDASNRALVTAGVPFGFEATYYYNLPSDGVAFNIMSNYGSAFIYTYNGAINLKNFYYNGTYILTNITPVQDDTIVVFANLPCIADQPVVRAIRANSNRLKTTEDHGIVTLDVDKYIYSNELVASPSAISSISEDGVVTQTSVVSGIRTDGTITAVESDLGYVILSLNGARNKIYPNIVSLNLATSTVINNRIVYVLPAGMTSSILGKIVVPNVADGFVYKAEPFFEPAGLNGAFDFKVDINFEYIKQGTDSGIPVSGTSTYQQVSETVNNNTKYLFTTGTNSILTIDTAGELYLKIQTTNPPSSSNILMGFGVFLTLSKPDSME